MSRSPSPAPPTYGMDTCSTWGERLSGPCAVTSSAWTGWMRSWHPHMFFPWTQLLTHQVLEFCGPTVLPKVWATVKFVLERFRLPVLQSDPAFQTLDERVFHRLGADAGVLQEAPVVSLQVARRLESDLEPLVSAFIGQSLVCLWRSPRHDNALHISPRSVLLRNVGLELKKWHVSPESWSVGRPWRVQTGSAKDSTHGEVKHKGLTYWMIFDFSRRTDTSSIFSVTQLWLEQHAACNGARGVGDARCCRRNPPTSWYPSEYLWKLAACRHFVRRFEEGEIKSWGRYLRLDAQEISAIIFKINENKNKYSNVSVPFRTPAPTPPYLPSFPCPVPSPSRLWPTLASPT